MVNITVSGGTKILNSLFQPIPGCLARINRCVKNKLMMKRMTVPAATKIWAAMASLTFSGRYIQLMRSTVEITLIMQNADSNFRGVNQCTSYGTTHTIHGPREDEFVLPLAIPPKQPHMSDTGDQEQCQEYRSDGCVWNWRWWITQRMDCGWIGSRDHWPRSLEKDVSLTSTPGGTKSFSRRQSRCSGLQKPQCHFCCQWKTFLPPACPRLQGRVDIQEWMRWN